MMPSWVFVLSSAYLSYLEITMRVKENKYRTTIIFDSKREEEEMLNFLRPHGEWIPYTTIDGYTKHATCTNCGFERKVGVGCSLDIDNLPKFCENCGSDNRKKGDIYDG